MISATADYALRASLLLARSYGTKPMSGDDIADSTGAPRNYMSKVLNTLSRAGVLTSARGPTGGFSLAAAPERVTLAQVIDVFDEPRPHTRCLLGNGPCTPSKPCAAHNTWTAVLNARRRPLVDFTLADLIQSN